MITLFSTPKPFRGHTNTIQRNAIQSWTLLDPRPEIILVGDDEGVAEICAEFGLRHLPQVGCTQYGTPLLSSLFEIAEKASTHDLMCYVNADIILMSDFIPTIRSVESAMGTSRFLVIGRKTNLAIPDLLNFGQPEWEANLRKRAQLEGTTGTADTDYLVFRRGLWPTIPPFAIGRYFWTQWLIYSACKFGATVLDATASITAIESAHDYMHVRAVAPGEILTSPEVRENAELFRGCKYWTTANATHVLTRTGIRRQPIVRKALAYVITLDHTMGIRSRQETSLALRSLLALYRAVRPVPRAVRRFILGTALK